MADFPGRPLYDRAAQQVAATFRVGRAERRFVLVDGVQIAWYGADACRERAAADPVVLLHGFCSMSYTWHEVFDQIAGARAIDLKGFGASDKPADGAYRIETQAEMVLRALDALCIRRAVLVGNSLGAAVALHIAQCRPQRVSGLILISPAAFHTDKFPAWKRLVLAGTRLTGEPFAARIVGLLAGIPGLIESRMRQAYHLPDTMTPERVAAYTAMLRDPQCQRAIVATLRSLDLRAIERGLSSTVQPVLIIQGEYDTIIPPRFSRQLARILPRAELKMLPCGHGPQEEMPAQFVRLVNDFLTADSADSGCETIAPVYVTSRAESRTV